MSLTTNTCHMPAGTLAGDGFRLRLTPETAGWTYSGLWVLDLAPGQSHSLDTGPDEMVVLPLSGHQIGVECDGATFQLQGRGSVFDGPSDFVYLPPRARVRVHASPSRPASLAFPSARASRRLPVRYGPAADVPVELRGAGQCSRQVHNFCGAGVFEADKLIAVEVLTPAGNWSSYPPHKHDENVPGMECPLEEVYYFRIRESSTRESPPDGSPLDGATPSRGMAYQRVYGTPERPIDVLAEVRDGDVVCMPHGWHGPSMAVPGYDLYYLNVMAGPNEERAWLIRDDPAHAWIRRKIGRAHV